MGGELDLISAAEAKSLLAWWLEAGVDAPVQETSRDWLRAAPAIAPSIPATADGGGEEVRHFPETLDLFRDWLRDEPALPMASAGAKRVLPHGAEGAAVMLLCDTPVAEDATAEQPIGGESWRLAERMLAAIGIPPDQAYSASLSCFHTPGARMSGEERQRCADIARRHIALVKPRRLLLLGDGPALALTGKRLVEARGHVHKIEGVRAVATFHPRHLIKRPLDKALTWPDLLLLMEEEA